METKQQNVCMHMLTSLVSAFLAVLSMWLQKIFLTSKFSYLLFFPTPCIKLKLGLQIGGRLLIATHLDQSNYLTNQQQVLVLAVPFTSLSKLCKMLGQNRFAEPNQHVLTFLHPILICRVTDWAPVELLKPTGALTLYYTLGCQDGGINNPVRPMKVSWLSNNNKCKSKRERQKEPPVVAWQHQPHVLPNSQNLQFQHLCCLLPLLTWLNSELSRRPVQLPRAQLQVK
jgi:hypothetical protein